MAGFDERDALCDMVDSVMECALETADEMKNKGVNNLDSTTLELGIRLDLARTLLLLTYVDDDFVLTKEKISEVEYITAIPPQIMNNLITYVQSVEPQAFIDSMSERSPVIHFYAAVDGAMSALKSDYRIFPEFFKLNCLAGQYIINVFNHSVLRQRHLLSARLAALVADYSQLFGGFIKK